jgi:hypothetical protein
MAVDLIKENLKENQIEESEKLTNQRRLLMLKKKSIKK